MTITTRIAKRLEPDTLCGGSGAKVFTDTEDRKWVVKSPNNPQGLSVLVAELVCGQLAASLNLPVPEVTTIDVPEALVTLNNICYSNGTSIAHGLSFGSAYIENNNNNPTPDQMSKISNPRDVPGIVVFDTWVNNQDHDGNNTNLLVSQDPHSPGKFRYYLIDLGIINETLPWRTGDLAGKRDHMPRHGHNASFQSYLCDPTAFEPFLTTLESLTRSQIEEVIDTVPNEWMKCPRDPEWTWDQPARDQLLDYLDYRRTLVRSVIRTHYPLKP